MVLIKFYKASSAQGDEVLPPSEENVSSSAQGDEVPPTREENVLNVLNDSVISDTSLGFSDSLINGVLGNIQNVSDVNVSGFSDISVREISFSDRDNNIDANHINRSNPRPKRQKKEPNYCENREGKKKQEVSESEEEYVQVSESESDGEFVLAKSIAKSNIVKGNGTPYKRKAGRPNGAKNKKKGPKSKKGKIHHIRQKTHKNPQITAENNQSNLLNINVDDEENTLSSPTPNENENLVTEDLNDSTIIGETGCTSPVKKKSPKKTCKRQRNEKLWKVNVRKELRNSGKEYITKNKDGRLVTKPARKIGPPCKCLKKCYEKFDSEAIKEIFQMFWNLGSYILQSQYLAQLIDRNRTKKELKYGAENKSRVKCINTYHVNYGGDRIVVCKQNF